MAFVWFCFYWDVLLRAWAYHHKKRSNGMVNMYIYSLRCVLFSRKHFLFTLGGVNSTLTNGSILLMSSPKLPENNFLGKVLKINNNKKWFLIFYRYVLHYKKRVKNRVGFRKTHLWLQMQNTHLNSWFWYWSSQIRALNSTPHISY